MGEFLFPASNVIPSISSLSLKSVKHSVENYNCSWKCWNINYDPITLAAHHKLAFHTTHVILTNL